MLYQTTLSTNDYREPFWVSQRHNTYHFNLTFDPIPNPSPKKGRERLLESGNRFVQMNRINENPPPHKLISSPASGGTKAG